MGYTILKILFLSSLNRWFRIQWYSVRYGLIFMFFIFFIFCAIAMLKVAGALSASTDIMKSLRSLVNAPELMGTMRTLQDEMNKVS